MPNLFAPEDILSEEGFALFDDELSDVQALIDSGAAWKLEGSVGRACAAAIEAGEARLGNRPFRDYYGGLVPAWWMVEPGFPGSPEFAGLDRPEEPSETKQDALCEAVGLVRS